jgi:hypothetical protein
MDEAQAHTLKYTTTQDLLLELIRRTEHNAGAFPGQQIHNDLNRNRDLWQSCSVWMGLFRSMDPAFASLIPLRDLDQASHELHADELFILATGKDNDKLLAIAQSWTPDECFYLDPTPSAMMLGGGWFTKNHTTGEITSNLLRVWFD